MAGLILGTGPRSAIAAILSGAAAKYDRESGEKTVLKCPVDAGMPKTE